MRRALLAFLALVALALPASALATASVTVGDSSYTPTSVSIKAGDGVTWTWSTNVLNSPLGRSVTSDLASSDSSYFDSGAQANGATYSHTFNIAGRYGYHDSQGGGQTGSVIVYTAPSLALAPASSTLNRGQAVTFTATADTNPTGAALTYEWDLDGDGTYETAGGTSQTVAYPNAGVFSVGVRVTDAVGNQTAAAASVQVNVPDSDGDGFNDDVDKCPNNAGVAPDGCPLVAPLVPGRISASAVSNSELGVEGALRGGVNVVLNCSAACTGVLTLTRNGQPIALPTTTTLGAPGSQLVTLSLTGSAKRALARSKASKLLLQVVVTDALGRTKTLKAGIALVRVKTYGKLPAVGISDNQPSTFDDPKFQILRLKLARLVSPWNAIFSEPARLDAWLQAARAHGIRPLVAFEHARGMACPGTRCKGPSKAQYARAWKAFHRKYAWVKDISPWNEVNSATQPTGAHPEMAATYYNVVRAGCRGCTIIAADLLDAPNIRRYAYAFLAKAQGKPRLWGLHNYTDTNRFRSRGTTALLQAVRGSVWLTETGGVVRFVTQKGKVALPKSETRAEKAMAYMFRLAEENASRIKRIYVYQWKVNNAFDRFDAGLVRPDGTPRPSYEVLALNASIARKR